MIAIIKNKIYNYFSKGHERSLKAKKNIFVSLLLKGGSIAIGLLLIPMTIKYVNPTQYGIWLTLSSIISWFSFFDIGLGNGLKNKLAETNALEETNKSKIYVSTTYAILFIISLVFLLIYFIGSQFLDWSKILNVQDSISADLGYLALVTVAIFCVQFFVQIINTVLTACHEVAKVSYITLIGQVLSLIVIYILTKHTAGSLIYLIVVLAGLPVLVQIFASFWLYNTSYKNFSPKFNLIDFKYAKDLLKVGGIFFVIQIGALILFQTDNIVITQLFGPKQVTTFNIAYKLFSVFILSFNIIMTPLWSSFTDAYAKRDFNWIKKTIFKMRIFWVLISLGSICLFFISPFIYKLWLGDNVRVPVLLSLSMALYVIAFSWQTLHVYFLNGIGKIKLQLYLVLISSVINIPIAIFLGKRIGLAGVTLSNTILFVIMGIIFSIQTKKIVNNTATSIFNT